MALPPLQCCTIIKEQGKEGKAWVLSKQPLTLGCGLLPTASFILGFKQRRKGFHWRPSKPMGLEKQSSAIPTWAHSMCCAALHPSLAEYLQEVFYSLHPFHCQELHNRTSWPCPWSKNTNKEGSLLEFLSSDDLHTSLLRPQGFNLVPGCLIGGYSIKHRDPFIPYWGSPTQKLQWNGWWAELESQTTWVQVSALSLISYGTLYKSLHWAAVSLFIKCRWW